MTFLAHFAEGMPTGMAVPDEFAALFRWMEETGCVSRSRSGAPFAVLDPSELGATGGSSVMFYQPAYDPYWTNCWDPMSAARLASFARTGGDGSMAAFWADGTGAQRIVHLGSGSGSTMVGVMVPSPLDFLRLLAIGYPELCWPEDHADPPEEPTDVAALRTWLTTTYDTTIPATAAEIVLPMSELGAAGPDPFTQWLATLPETPKPD